MAFSRQVLMTREGLRAVRDILSVVSPLVGDLGKNFAELDRPDTFDLSDTKINCVSILSELVSLFQEFSDGLEKCAGLGADRMRELKEQIEVAQSENHALATEIISPKPVVMMDGYKRISKLDQARRKIDEILSAAEEAPAESEGGSSADSVSESAPAREEESPKIEEPFAPVMGGEDPQNPLPPETPVDLLKFIETPQEKTAEPPETVSPETEKKEAELPPEISKPADRSASLIYQGFEKIGGVPDLDRSAAEPEKGEEAAPVIEPKTKKEKKKKPPKTESAAREPQSSEPEATVSEPVISVPEGPGAKPSEVSPVREDLPPISKQRVWPPPPENISEPEKPVEVSGASKADPPRYPEPPPVPEKELAGAAAGLHIQAPEDDKSIHHDFEQMKLLNDELINKVRSLEEQIEKLAGRKDQMAEVLESRLQRRIDFFEEKIQQTKNELAGEIEKKGIVIEKKLSAIVEKQEEKIVAQVRGAYEARPEASALPSIASGEEPAREEETAAEIDEAVVISGPSIFVQAIKVFLIALVLISLLAFGAYYLLTRGQSAPVAARTQKAATQTYDILPTPAFDRMTQKVPVSLDKRYLRLLVIQLKNNPDPKIRTSMARRLAKWPWKDVPEILLETGMRDSNPDVVKVSFETFKTVTGFPHPEDLSYAAAETWWLTNKPAVDPKLADAE